MSRARAAALAGAALLAAAAVAAAEKAYVTDRVFLGLYAEPGVGRPFRSLETGTPLEVLERRGRWVRVRTPKGEEGWVRAAYLMPQPPARVTMPALKAEHERLKAELGRLKAELGRAGREAQALRRELEAARAARAEAEAAREAARREAAALQAELAAGGPRVPLGAALLGVGGALALGLAAGWWLLDRRIRRRYGGYRIW